MIIRGQPAWPYRYFGVLALLAAVAIAIAVYIDFDVNPLSSFLCGINSASIFFMGLDKSLAKSRAARFPEAILYLLALLGGAPGIIVGTHLFKHKNRKAAFQFVLLMVVAIQICVLQLLGVHIP